MQGAVVERPLSHFVGFRVTAAFDELGDMVSQARRSLLARQFEISRITDRYRQLGVTLPQEQEQSEDHITTYIGFEVEEYGDVPADLVRIDLQPGKYAQFMWKGSLESAEFEAFYPGIFNWFREQSMAPSTASPWIEVYGEDHDWEDRSNPENRLEALIPLAGGPH